MAHTARPKKDTREAFDSAAELERKTTQLADLVAQSRHIIAFTGAGISTSAGIPDYRSALDTCLDVGPGAAVPAAVAALPLRSQGLAGGQVALAAAQRRTTAATTGQLRA